MRTQYQLCNAALQDPNQPAPLPRPQCAVLVSRAASTPLAHTLKRSTGATTTKRLPSSVLPYRMSISVPPCMQSSRHGWMRWFGLDGITPTAPSLGSAAKQCMASRATHSFMPHYADQPTHQVCNADRHLLPALGGDLEHVALHIEHRGRWVGVGQGAAVEGAVAAEAAVAASGMQQQARLGFSARHPSGCRGCPFWP